MNVRDLEGPMLDYWVARANGFSYPKDLRINSFDGVRTALTCAGDFGPWSPCTPSTDWAHGGPIIERVRTAVMPRDLNDPWSAVLWLNPEGAVAAQGLGQTPLIAAMRAFVASKFGDTVSDGVEE